MNFQVVFKILSRILFISALALVGCMLVALYFGEAVHPFVFSVGIAFGSSLFLYLITTKKDIDIGKKEAFLSATMSWIVISLLGTLPYIFSGSIPSFVDALFESVSGFTTTGSSVLPDIEALPKSILFWRSLTHWIGGIGIIVLVIIIMPSLRMGSYNLFSLESSLQEKIIPRMKDLGYRLLLIYLVITCLEVFFLWLGKMSLFESVCHAMSTVSTGGFSPKNTSIMNYSPYIQYVILIFMILSGINFVVFFFMINRRFKKVKENEELKYYLLLVLLGGAFVTCVLYLHHEYSVEQSFRYAYFQVVSIITGTGFITSDYLAWTALGGVFIFLLMFVGGCMGSTSGGIKIGRYVVLFKNFRQTFLSYIHPNSIKKITISRKNITPEDSNSIISFMAMYFFLIVVGTVCLIIIGIDVQTAVGATVQAIGNVGVAIGSVGSSGNFGHLPDVAKLIISFFMILGRLEIYTILMLFIPLFWKKV